MTHSTRFYEIDLMRFIAAVMVVIFHYTFVGYMLGYVDTFRLDVIGEVTRYFYLGINFFFVISGFVIFMSASDGQLRRFIASRAARLYPAYIVAVVLTSVVFIGFDHEKFTLSWHQVAVNLSMFQTAFSVPNIESAYWTLWIELQFYCAIAVLVYFKWLKHMLHIIAASLVVCTALLFTAWHSHFDVWTNALPHWWGYFASGCLFYLVWRDGLNTYKSILLLLSLIFMCQQNLLFADMMTGWYGVPFNKLIIVFANLIFFGLFCMSIFCKRHPFRHAKYLSLGALTYPLYLVHQNVGYVIFNAFGNTENRYLLVLATCALMMAVAWLIYRFIEKPLAPLLKAALLGNNIPAEARRTGHISS